MLRRLMCLSVIRLRLRRSVRSRTSVPHIGTTLNILEAETQWANRSELWVGLVKESTHKDLRDTGSPIVLWDYCMERQVLISQVTAKKELFQLHGTNPHTATFGTQADILNLCLFGWYEWIYFRDQQAAYPFQKECLGRCVCFDLRFKDELLLSMRFQSLVLTL